MLILTFCHIFLEFVIPQRWSSLVLLTADVILLVFSTVATLF